MKRQNKTKTRKQIKKRIRKLIKIIMEAIIVIISCHHNTMKIVNNNKSGNVEKKTQTIKV